MGKKDHAKLRELLEDQYDWPANYLFKMIVPSAQIEFLRNLFKGEEIQEKPSGKGNYISVTVNMKMNSADEVIEIYKRASTIEGIISL